MFLSQSYGFDKCDKERVLFCLLLKRAGRIYSTLLEKLGLEEMRQVNCAYFISVVCISEVEGVFVTSERKRDTVRDTARRVRSKWSCTAEYQSRRFCR